MGECIEIVKILIDAGAKLDLLSGGYTSLMGACLRGQTKVVKYLINKGADINLQNKNGETALMIASENMYSRKGKEILKFLIKKGAKLDLQNKEGNTALMTAYKWRRWEAVKLLIDGGATIDKYQYKKIKSTSEPQDIKNLIENLIENEEDKKRYEEAEKYLKNYISHHSVEKEIKKFMHK
jgi:ankyrin repeat protein